MPEVPLEDVVLPEEEVVVEPEELLDTPLLEELDEELEELPEPPLLDELEEELEDEELLEVVVPQIRAAEPEAAQIIGTPLGSVRLVVQSAAPLLRHFIQGLLAGQVGISPLVQ